MIFRAFDRILTQVLAHRLRFFAVFIGVVTLTYGFLYTVDFVPEAPEENAERQMALEEIEEEETGVPERPARPAATDATPDRIFIDSLDREVAVLNPESTSVSVLDNTLLSGVVRHPASANLLEDGTVFLFGHSSYLPIVHNKNFQAFNDIKDLVWGDKIRIQSSDYEYVYRVDRVYEVKATTAEVVIESEGKELTLVTCNTFGSKEDRFVVEASLVDSYPL